MQNLHFPQSLQRFGNLSWEQQLNRPQQAPRLGRTSPEGAIDYDEFQRRFEGTEQDFQEFLLEHCTVVDVTPGVYRTTDRPMGWPDDHNESSPFHHAVIEFVRDPDPVEDFAVKYDTDIEAGQVLFSSILRYPILYLDDDDLKYLPPEEFIERWRSIRSERQMRALARAADQLLCTNGNGIEWNEGGWGCGDPDVGPASLSFPIPVFDRQFNWYPISPGFCTLLAAAGMHRSSEKGGSSDRSNDWQQLLDAPLSEDAALPLNKSFRELAFNVAQCIIRHGVAPSSHDQDGNEARGVIRYAAVAFVRLARMYSQDVPEYCRSLISSDPGDICDSARPILERAYAAERRVD